MSNMELTDRQQTLLFGAWPAAFCFWLLLVECWGLGVRLRLQSLTHVRKRTVELLGLKGTLWTDLKGNLTSFAAAFGYITCMPSWPDIPTPVSATWIILTSLAPSPTEKRGKIKTSFAGYHIAMEVARKDKYQTPQRSEKHILMDNTAAYGKP